MTHKIPQSVWVLTISIIVATGIVAVTAPAAPRSPQRVTLSPDTYFDKVRGAWQVTLVANYTGLEHEGLYLAEPSPAERIELVLLDQWPTDDDTAVEWVDLHILETYGLTPSYSQIRDEWVDHLNHDIWVSTRRARDLMDEGVIPPDTGGAALNPDGVWSIDAQLQTELFGLLAPGLPQVAMDKARYFAKVTNSGIAVEVSAFYASMYADGFFETDVVTVLQNAQARFEPQSAVNQIVDMVTECHERNPHDWRICRREIRDLYDTDPEWWGARVNFASMIMSLLYGQGDLMATMTIGSLAGWDADNNVTTAAGLLALMSGFSALPLEFQMASSTYFNEDVTGDLPKTETVATIAQRTQRLAETLITESGGTVTAHTYLIPRQ